MTVNATYRKNIGMLFRRKYSVASGELCSSCHEKFFNAGLTNIFLGWWGIISFVINSTCQTIMNIGNYIGTWKIRRHDNYYNIGPVDWKLIISLGIVAVVGTSVFFNSNTNNYSSGNKSRGGEIALVEKTPTKIPATQKPEIHTPLPGIQYEIDYSMNDGEWYEGKMVF